MATNGDIQELVPPEIDVETVSSNLQHFTIEIPKAKQQIHVYLQGDRSLGQVPVLTVHDLGANHNMWLPLTCHPSMMGITERSYFIHVCVPGQEDNATDLPKDYNFPTIQLLGEYLVHVLDHLQIRQVVCIGEGAGANAIARFALEYADRVYGIVLIHCTGTTAGFMETMNDKMMGWKLNMFGHHAGAETYLVVHRFGDFKSAHNKDDMEKVVKDFQATLRSTINPKNLKIFIEAFLKRSNLTDKMRDLKVPVLFVTGDRASHNHTVHTLYSATLRSSHNRAKGIIWIPEFIM